MSKIILVLSVICLLFISGCSNSKTVDYSQFKMPNMSQVETFEVGNPDGHIMTSYDIPHEKEYDAFEEWKSRQEEKENVDRYNMIRDVYDNFEEIKEEEYELEEYCNTLHSNSCLDMEWIKDHNGCREVEVECKKYDTDDICIRYEFDVKEELHDEDDCLN